MNPWNGWYHVTCNTYGTWLPGDDKGWRERGHKKHVEGDYKNPPPKGSGTRLHAFADKLLQHPPVRLSTNQRQTVGQALVEMLLYQKIEIITLSLDAVHFHILGRFRNKKVRSPVGRAKKHACFHLRDFGHTGKLWQHESHVLPIKDRQHQINVYGYIINHKNKGAWTWTYHQGIYWSPTIKL